jgi:hypothetical protein
MGSDPLGEQTTGDVGSRTAFGRSIDYVLGGILVVIGVLGAVSGYLIYRSVEHQWIAEAVRNGEFQSDVLTEAEAIDIAVALGNWGALGLIAVGVLFIGLGFGVVFVHGRTRKTGGRTPQWILGVVGASVGTLLSFVPFAPIIGGAVAGYLDTNKSASGIGSGALVGLITMLPVVVWSTFAGFGLVTTIDAELTGLVVMFGAIALIFSFLYFLLLSALGGYIGGKLR